MTAVECARNSGPYSRQVSGGVLESAPLTGKNISVGLRITWTVQFAADQSARMISAAASMRIAGGAASAVRSARRPDRRSARNNGRKRAIPAGRARVLREGGPAEREFGMKAMLSTVIR